MPEHPLLGVWVRRFLLEHVVAERNLSRNTQRSYRDTFALLLPFVSTRKKRPIDRLYVADFSSDILRCFLDHLERERKCSIRSRNQRLAAIHAFAHFVADHSPEDVTWCAAIRSVETHVHAQRHLAKAGVARRKGRGISHPWSGDEAGAERTKRSEGLHKRSAEDRGNPLRRAIGAEPLSVLSTCVTKQTGDMVYSEARRLPFLSFSERLTMLYALERESNLGSTFAVLIELSEGRDVGSGPVSRVWDFTSNCLSLDQPLQRDRPRGTSGSQPPPAYLFARDA